MGLCLAGPARRRGTGCIRAQQQTAVLYGLLMDLLDPGVQQLDHEQVRTRRTHWDAPRGPANLSACLFRPMLLVISTTPLQPELVSWGRSCAAPTTQRQRRRLERHWQLNE